MPSKISNGNRNNYYHDDEIVITGISGRFPESANIEELARNLYDGVDMVNDAETRWPAGMYGTPTRLGKLKRLEDFDASFFAIHSKQADTMDPQMRIMQEATYECLIDSGYNPAELRGSKTGVYIGCSITETEEYYTTPISNISGYNLTGCCRGQIPNRISYCFDFRGPSFALDTACSSTFYALNEAVRAIKDGQCDAAIVGGSNICLKATTSLCFHRLGMISNEGKCRTFDENGKGYVRAETVAVMFVQKKKDARRMYATIEHIKTNNDGYKTEGITYPSGDIQKQLILDVYRECGININDVNYVETHGTGTPVGDPEEANTVAEAFCIKRKEPLLIGAVKSNMGHSEAGSGMCSLAKVILAMENGIIPGNLHYKTPNKAIPALIDGRMKVVSENTPWQGGLVALNSFGFGGANCHLLIRSNPTSKLTSKYQTFIPRLITVSGRTQEAVEYMLDNLENQPTDHELYALLDSIHRTNIPGHHYRGYSVLTNKATRSVSGCSPNLRPIWYIFSGMGSQWPGMARELMELPVFKKSLELSAALLKEYKLNLIELLLNGTDASFENILNSFVCIAAMQIALVDTLHVLGIKPNGMVGHSVGELGCAYADGTLTAAQTILAAYWRGRSVVDTELPAGLMAAVGLSWKELEKRLPPTIYRACHNSGDNVTISGPPEDMTKFVKVLTDEGVFAKAVNVAGYAFHSKYINDAGPKLLEAMKKIIPNPKPRSKKWICSSIPESRWNEPLAQLSSAEYHVNNLLSSVQFHPAVQHVPENAIVIEIAPHALLLPILKRSLPSDCTITGLLKRKHPNNLEHLLENIGKIYVAGAHPQLSAIYPKVSYPVSRSTPSLSSLVCWDHSTKWTVAKFWSTTFSNINVEVDLRRPDDLYMAGHTIDGRILYPATGFVVEVWEELAQLYNKDLSEFPIVMEDVTIHRATILPRNSCVKFLVNIHDGSGEFEVCESGSQVATGKIRRMEYANLEEFGSPSTPSYAEIQEAEALPLQTADVYKYLRLRGYEYSGLFQGIKECNIEGTRGTLAWYNNWITFMDSMMQFTLFSVETNKQNLYVPTRIQKIVINPQKHLSHISENNDVPVYSYRDINLIKSGGIEIRHGKNSLAPRKPNIDLPKLEEYTFVPYDNEEPSDEDDHKAELNALVISLQIFLENAKTFNLKIGEVVSDESPETILATTVHEVFASEPMIRTKYTVFTSQPEDNYTEILKPLSIEIVKSNFEDSTETNFNLLIGVDSIKTLRIATLKKMVESLAPSGAILLKEDVDISQNDVEVILKETGLQVVSHQKSIAKGFILLRRSIKVVEHSTVLYITNTDFSWVNLLKTALKESDQEERRIYLVNNDEETSGIIGLVNCLKLEPNGEKLRLYFTSGIKESFSIASRAYVIQLKKDLIMNVYKNGVWGSYRHLEIDNTVKDAMIEVEHAYINNLVRGDLSSFRFIQSNLGDCTSKKDASKEVCTVYYSSINFRDIMLASGKITADSLPGSHGNQECLIGLEYCGRNSKGRRIFGLSPGFGLATSVSINTDVMWYVPDDWTLEEAATVPIAYSTVYYAFIVRGGMLKGESVLIHSGAGGVGIAAIAVALSYDCTVYTTVGSAEKRQFLKSFFPQLTDDNIGNSHDTSFEKFILEKTKGRGVDIVLNSLADDKYQASLRCLADNGRFLEIGKYDLARNTPVGSSIFLKNTTFHGVLVDQILFNGSNAEIKTLHNLLQVGLDSGAVRPLPVNLFKEDQIEDAFRFMASGKHIGKVVIKYREEEIEKLVPNPAEKFVLAIPRTYMNSSKSFIVTGGLGGFGLELSDWLVSRGVTKLVLTSRTGIQNGYQAIQIRRWRKQGFQVIISKVDISTLNGARQLLMEANQLAPIGGIFHLACVLKDGFIESLSEEDFITVCRPKVDGAKYLDIASRDLAPSLNHFVMFSSVACGRGNAGQSNYGFANSVMERIAEVRQSVNLPGKAIQWGVIGDVGIVMEKMSGNNNTTISGTVPQRITSCLDTLGLMLTLPNAVMSSMVVADKQKSKVVKDQSDILSAVGHILGLKDVSKVSTSTNLADLGMDSIMGTEIKQMLERDYDLILSVPEVRGLTFDRLKQLTSGDATLTVNNNTNIENGGQVEYRDYLSSGKLIPEEIIVRLNPNSELINCEDPVFFVHPIDGFVDALIPTAKGINHPVYGIQCTKEAPLSSLVELVLFYIEKLKMIKKKGPYIIVGYSYGSVIAFEMALQLEQDGEQVKLVLIDGSPYYVSLFTATVFTSVDDQGIKATNESDVFAYFVSLFNKTVDPVKISSQLRNLKSWNERQCEAVKILKEATSLPEEELSAATLCFFRKMAIAENYTPERLLEGQITLITAKNQDLQIEKDLGLGPICREKVKIHVLEGNHNTMIAGTSAMKVSEIINSVINN